MTRYQIEKTGHYFHFLAITKVDAQAPDQQTTRLVLLICWEIITSE